MDFSELILKRQACRRFNGKKVERETLEKILNDAIKSPSACNSQPWKLYSAITPEKVKAVAESLQDEGRNSFVENATCFVAIAETDCKLKSDVAKKFSETHFVKYDIGEITAYLTLSAKNNGVDSCIIGWLNPEKLKTALSIPDGEICNIVVALGYSDIDTREKIRNPLSSVSKIY